MPARRKTYDSPSSAGTTSVNIATAFHQATKSGLGDTPTRSGKRRANAVPEESVKSPQRQPKYTALLRERTYDSSPFDSFYNDRPFAREEEIFRQWSESEDRASEPPMNSDLDFFRDDSPFRGKREFTPTPRSPDAPRGAERTLPAAPFLKKVTGYVVSGLAVCLNCLGFIPFLVGWCIKEALMFLWINLTGNGHFSSILRSATPSSVDHVAPNPTLVAAVERRRRLIWLIVVPLLLLLFSVRIGEEQRGVSDLFRRIQPPFVLRLWPADDTDRKIIIPSSLKIPGGAGGGDDDGVGDGKDNGIVLTVADLKTFIADEVKVSCANGGDAGEERLYDPKTNELREIISTEVKSFCSQDVKSELRSELKAEVDAMVSRTKMQRLQYRGNDIVDLIRNEARKVVEEELLVFSQDKLNRPDFALHSGGAKVISRLTSKTYELWPERWYQRVFSYVSNQGILRGKPPVTAISPDTHVGQCWPFPGRRGQLAVLLNRRVYVTAITYDHVSKDVAVDVGSAPKHFEVWGIVDDGKSSRRSRGRGSDEEDDGSWMEWMESTEEECGVRQDGQYEPKKTGTPGEGSSDSLSGLDPDLDNVTADDMQLGTSKLHHFLGQYTYDVNGLPVQTFEVPENIRRSNRPVRAVIFKIQDNWGKNAYTCLYRFRVHGDPVERAEL